MTIREIINRGYGATYRNRDYYGNRVKREEVWRVNTTITNGSRESTLYHYGVALVTWDRDTHNAWLSDYASNPANLTTTDIRGIRKVSNLI